MTPIETATNRTARSISVGLYSYPLAIGLAPSGETAFVLGNYSGTVRSIDLATGQVLARIKVGGYPVAIAFGR